VGVAVVFGVTAVTIVIWLNNGGWQKIGEIANVISKGIEGTLQELREILNRAGEIARNELDKIEQYVRRKVEKPILRGQTEDEKEKPILPGQDEEDGGSYLHAFGNTRQPRPPRQVDDIPVDGSGYVVPQPEPKQPWPKGASTFGNVALAPLTGHYHRIPRQTLMPKGLEVMADGKEVGGPHGPTHHTIYPIEKMLYSIYRDLFLGLGWEYGGNKRGVKK
jgi:hypothetical protein